MIDKANLNVLSAASEVKEVRETSGDEMNEADKGPLPATQDQLQRPMSQQFPVGTAEPQAQQLAYASNMTENE